MQRHHRYLIGGILTLTLILGFGLNAKSKEIPFVTTKSDRTLIKEIHASQKEALQLLKEIKSMLQGSP